MKTAIIGAGAMGCMFGARLAMTQADISLVDVNKTYIDAINNNGVRMKADDGVFTVSIPCGLATDFKKPFDLVILLTKTMYSKNALDAARHLIGKNTYLMTLQNGLGNMETICAYVDKAHAIVGVTNVPSDLVAPGSISTSGTGYLKVTSVDGQTNKALTFFAEHCKKAGFDIEVSQNAFVAIWEKVGFNCAINGISAICRTTCGGLGETKEIRLLAHEVCREVAMVANAYNIQASAEAIIASVEHSIVSHRYHFASMTQDIHNKRITEVATINGGVVAKARDAGLHVPYNETLYALIHTVEKTYNLQEINQTK